MKGMQLIQQKSAGAAGAAAAMDNNDDKLIKQKEFGMGTVHNTLADEGHDDDGTTTGASGGNMEHNEAKNFQMNQINMLL